MQRIKVAVIGPPELVARIEPYGAHEADVQLISSPYTHETQAAGLAERVDAKVDAILFTGPVPYMMASEVRSRLHAPLLHVNYGGAGLYRVLFQMQRDGRLLPGTCISLDFIDRVQVLQELEELELDDIRFRVFEIREFTDTQVLTQQHLEQWRENRASAVITCLYSVYRHLVQAGVPAYCIVPTRSAIQHALRAARDAGQAKLLKNHQIAACIVSAGPSSPLSSEDAASLVDVMSDVLQTSCQRIDEDKYLFYTTRGFILALTDGYNKPLDLPWHRGMLVMGVGLGITAKEAQAKASDAYQKSRSEFPHPLYIVGNEHEVVRIQPDFKSSRLQYDSRTYDVFLRKIAETTNLSIATLTKIQYVMRVAGREAVTAADLSKQLDITLRSARRILKTLQDHGYAQVVGEEQPITRGRPRNVYRLDL